MGIVGVGIVGLGIVGLGSENSKSGPGAFALTDNTICFAIVDECLRPNI